MKQIIEYREDGYPLMGAEVHYRGKKVGTVTRTWGTVGDEPGNISWEDEAGVQRTSRDSWETMLDQGFTFEQYVSELGMAGVPWHIQVRRGLK